MNVKAGLASRHPRVVLVYDSKEDILGTAHIISDQEKNFRAITLDDKTRKKLFEYKPAVILFALSSVMDSVEFYTEMVADETLNYPHQSILLSSNKESGLAFHCCVKGLFDNYFVYQPLYEKFRLKLIVHAALMLTSSISKYEKYNDDLLDEIDGDLAQLIEDGSQCKAGLIGSIQECVKNIESVTVADIESTASPEEVLENITKNHVQPMLAVLEKDILQGLGSMVDNLLSHQSKTKKPMKFSATQNRDLNLAEELKQTDTSQTIHEEEALLAHNSAAVDDESLGAKRILIVEDNELYRNMLVTVLRTEKFEVEEASDGLAALDKIKDNHYDCVLMDLFMPKLDGLNTTKRLQQINEGKDLPVIALTGNKRKDLVKKWASFGLKGYLMKPSNKKDILEAVNKAI